MTKTKTLIEKSYDKNAPAEPMEFEQMDKASRADMNLRHAISQAERLLLARREGGSVSIDSVSLNLSRLDKARVFGFVWEETLKQLTSWEWVARRYFKFPKHLEQSLQSVRAQIDYQQNPEGD